MRNKFRGVLKVLLTTLCMALILSCMGIGGAHLFGLHTNNNKPIENPKQANVLSLSSGFSTNQYIIIGGKVYKYQQEQPQQNNKTPQTQTQITPVDASWGITFNQSNTLELIFIKDSITSFASVSVEENNIASILQATKKDESIDISITEKFDKVNIVSSYSADWTLGALAVASNNTLTYNNGVFAVNAKKSGTSLTAAQEKSEAQILYITSGTFSLSGDKTYSPKEGAFGRAFYMNGGTLTLTDITLDGFTDGGIGGCAVYSDNPNSTLNLNCTIQNCEAAGSGGVAYFSGTVNVTGGSYTNNSSDREGGAFFVYTNSPTTSALNISGGAIISNNTADSTGGAIALANSNLTINNATISNNTAANNGGGVYQSGGTSTLTSVNMTNNKTTGGNGNALCFEGGATSTINSGTYSTQDSNYQHSTVAIGQATVNIVNGTFVGYDYAFNTISDAGAQASYVLKGSPTIQTTSGNAFLLSSGTYLKIESSLSKTYNVVKSGLTSIDDGDAASSYIAYSADSAQLTTAKSKLTVTGYQTYHQHSTAMKASYLVCEYKPYTATFNGNGGTSTTRSVKYKAKLGDLPASSRTGYTQNGWWTEAGGGTQITKDTTMPANNVTYYAHWTANSYTVTLNNQGATTAGTTSVQATYNSAMPSITAPTKTGYTFNGYYSSASAIDLTSSVSMWSSTGRIDFRYSSNGWKLTTAGDKGRHMQISIDVVDSSLTTAPSLQFNDVVISGSYTTTAITNGWRYFVDFDIIESMVSVRNGTPYDASYRFIDVEGIKNTSTTITVNYAILDGKKYYSNTGSSMRNWDVAANATLYAKWTAITYIVAFNGNGNTGGSMSNQTHTYDTELALTANAFTKTGYTFNSWNTKSDGSGTKYTNSQKVKNLTATKGTTITLYAQWTANTYTIVFNGNGNTGGSMNNQKHTYDTELALTANAFTKTGYNFDSWNTKADGSGTKYTNSQKVKNLTATNGATINLYARWAAKSYTLTFNANKPGNATNSVSQTAASKTVTYDSTTNLTSSYTASLTGWTFNGYYTAASGGTQVFTSAGAIVKPVSGIISSTGTWVKDGSQTVYAQWTANTYTLTWNGNATAGDLLLAASWNYAGSAGYTSSNGGNNSSYTKSGVTATSSVTFDSAPSYKSPIPIRRGYTFNGWYDAATSGKKVADNAGNFVASVSGYTGASKQWIKSANATLYAQYTIKTYNVTVNNNGGNGSSSTTYTTATGATINAPTKTGYTFAGWTVTVSLDKVNNATINSSDGHQEYNATYKNAVYYELFYIKSGVSYTGALGGGDIRWRSFNASTGAYVSNVGSTATIDGNNSNIALWYHLGKSEATTTISFNAGASAFKTADYKLTGHVGLSANWTANKYTVVFNANGGSGTMVNQSFSYGESKALTANAFTRTGYNFLGWNTSSSATTALYTDKKTVSNLSSAVNGTVNLYAIWQIKTYTVTISVNNTSYGSVDKSSLTVNHGSAVSVSSNTITIAGTKVTASTKSVTGHTVTFSSWTNAPTSITQAVTITANFTATANKYKLNYNTQGGVIETSGSAPISTGYYLNWSNNVTISTVFNYAGAGTRYFVFGSYNGSNHFNVEITAANKLRMYINNANVDKTLSKVIPANTDIAITFSWTASSKTWSLSASGGAYSDSATGESTVTGTCGYAVAVGADYRGSSPFSSIKIAPLSITTGTAAAVVYCQNKEVTYNTAYGTLPTPTKQGNTFKGWFTATSGGTEVTSATKMTSAADTTIYAQWTTNKYSVTFHPNGGYRVSDNSKEPVTISYDYGHSEGISERRRTGYTLTGYTIKDTSGGTNIGGAYTTFDSSAKTGSVKVGSADIIVYMVWTPNVYKVTLNNQSATSAGTTEYYYQFNTTKTIDGVTCYYYTTSACTTGLKDGYYITVPTKTGHTFGGYYTATNGGGTQYVNASGGCVNNLYAAKAENTTLYAKWTVNKYTVTVTVNNATYGKVSATSITGVAYGTAVSSSGANLQLGGTTKSTATTKSVTGYTVTFTGWTNATGTITGARTITANFSATVNSYTVHIFKGSENLLSGAEMAVSSTTTLNNNCTTTYSPANGGTWNSKPVNTTDPYSTITQTVSLTANTKYYIHMTIRNTDGSLPSGSMQLFLGISRSYNETNSVRFHNGGGYAEYTPTTTGVYNMRMDNDYSGKEVVVTNFWVASAAATNYTTATVNYGATYNLGSPTRTGHAFNEWTVAIAAYSMNKTNTAITGTASVNGITLTMGAGHAYVFASYTRDQYTVTFNVTPTGYGVVAPTSINAYYGAAVTINNSVTGGSITIGSETATALAQGATGYTTSFANWSGAPANITGNKTITATFNRIGNVITITLNDNGGSGGSGSVYYRYNVNAYYNGSALTTSITSVTKPTRAGYTFKGYYSATSGGTQRITAAGAISSTLCAAYTANSTIYAQWTANKITITLNNQSATTAGTAAFYYYYGTATYYSDSACTTQITSITTPSKTGYSFSAYYTGANGTGTPQINTAGVLGNGLCTTFAYNTTLYAYYTSSIITITLNNQSATTAGTPTIYHKTGIATYYTSGACVPSYAITKITCPTKTGYTFGGYYTSTGGSGTQYINASGNFVNNLCNVNASRTLYAKWTGNMLTVTLNNQSATSAGTAYVYYRCGTNTYYQDAAGSTALTSITKPTRTGYTFGGYYTSTGGSGTQYINASGQFVNNLCNVNTSRTLYAKWTGNKITLTLNNQSATSAGSANVYYYYATATYYSNSACSTTITKITCPTKTGYTFKGYYTATSGGTQYITSSGTFSSSLHTAVSASRTLYARWSAKQILISLDKQGATTNGTGSVVYYYNTATYYPDIECSSTITSITIPTKTGYTFGGYYTSTNGGGTQYINASGGFVNNLYKSISSDKTLYAKWTIKTYTVSFDLYLDGESATDRDYSDSQLDILLNIDGEETYSYGESLTLPYGTEFWIVTVTESGDDRSSEHSQGVWTTAYDSVALFDWDQYTCLDEDITLEVHVYCSKVKYTISNTNSSAGTISTTSAYVPYGAYVYGSGSSLCKEFDISTSLNDLYYNSAIVTATAKSGYKFTRWATSSSGTTAYGAYATAATTVYAQWSQVANYTVSFSITPKFSGTVNPTSVTVPSGTTYSASGKTMTFKNGSTTVATVKATGATVLNTNYIFDSWSSTSGTITANKRITVTFVKGSSAVIKSIEFEPGGEGSGIARYTNAAEMWLDDKFRKLQELPTTDVDFDGISFST